MYKCVWGYHMLLHVHFFVRMDVNESNRWYSTVRYPRCNASTDQVLMNVKHKHGESPSHSPTLSHFHSH